ncbi:MAG: hypothetical protein Q7K43_06915, partial [Candidatus Woesearchaeota archaeon]|nr:hypothetical protein [Candidatus Woesearchaeota archaeon]
MSKKQNKTKSYLVLIIVAVAVLIGLVFIISGPRTGRAIALPQEVSYDEVQLDALCGIIPMTSNLLKIKQYSSVGDLRQALVLADLSSTLPLPLACVFDCGVRVLPARNEADFSELMSATNFGQTLSKYSCGLPALAVTNLKGEKVRLG